jgi:hypothetical protein
MKSDIEQDRLAELREEDKEPVQGINPDEIELRGIRQNYFNNLGVKNE